LFAFNISKGYFSILNDEINMKNELLYHFFSDDDFLDISNKIKEMEKITSGEIRVAIKEDAPLLDKKKDIVELATKEFYRLGMADTRDKTGILIYILLRKRKFHILADSGINEKVEQQIWNTIRDEMTDDFKSGNYLAGVISTLEKVGNILSTYFPIKKDDTNELSNKVVV
jgi:uncharacterized membrane protein